MRHLTLLLLGLAAGCSFPQHVARRTIEDSMPASGLRELHCLSHNGDITIQGRPGTSEVRMSVTLAVRGYTREEAERNLESLEVVSTTEGDRVTLTGKYDGSVRRMSPSFTFVLQAPPELAARLESHNGDIRVVDTMAALDCETHNGAIEARARTNAVKMVSHNGDVILDLDGEGALDGSVVTHNGNVVVGVAETMGTSIRANTHNGRLRLSRTAEETSRSRHRLDCRLGDGAGRLEIETHNGNVEIR